MLSYSAWQFYWVGRHLQRVEDTARAMLVQEMLANHPQGRELWSPAKLLDALGQTSAFTDKNKDAEALSDATAIFRFLYNERDNPCSLTRTIAVLREDMRAMLGLLPAEVWRYGSRLRDIVALPISTAGKRRQNLDDIIRYCRAIAGVVTTAMLRDTSFHFWQIGRRVECAEMTCRLLSCECANGGDGDDDNASAESFGWSNLLNALSINAAYRKSSNNAAPTQMTATHFIVSNGQLPRSVRACLSDVRDSLKFLPNNEKPLLAVAQAAKAATLPTNADKIPVKLNRILALCAAIDKSISKSYFIGVQ